MIKKSQQRYELGRIPDLHDMLSKMIVFKVLIVIQVCGYIFEEAT